MGVSVDVCVCAAPAVIVSCSLFCQPTSRARRTPLCELSVIIMGVYHRV